jgi:hypothetical protein
MGAVQRNLLQDAEVQNRAPRLCWWSSAVQQRVIGTLLGELWGLCREICFRMTLVVGADLNESEWRDREGRAEVQRPRGACRGREGHAEVRRAVRCKGVARVQEAQEAQERKPRRRERHC